MPESNRNSINRRQFLGSSARNAAHAAAGAVGLAGAGKASAETKPVKVHSSALETVRLGFVGLRNQGLTLLKTFRDVPNCSIASLCDIDRTVARKAIHELPESIGIIGRDLKLHDDFHKLLDDDSIDAVVIATPDHHHAWMTALAAAAGKHVYLEIPATHTSEQGQQLEAMINSSGIHVQVGLQQRSGAHFQSAIAFLQSGDLGSIHFARAWSSLKRDALQPKSSQEKFSFSRSAWLGQEAATDLHPSEWHFHWRWKWAFGSGELGNWGVHLLDIARWGLGVELPERIVATGSCEHFSDQRETPDTLRVLYDYGNQSIEWEHRQWSSRGLEGRPQGVAFYGDRGVLVIDRSGWKVYDRSPSISEPASELRQSHAANFVAAIREGEPLNAPFETGRISSELCHLGNLAYREGREIRFEA